MKSLACRCMLSAGLVGASFAASGQDFPTKPVSLVVPFGVGSTPDFTARFFAGEFSKRLGQQFIVENRPGIVGVRTVKTASPDGHVLLWDSGGAAIRQVLIKNPDFDVRADFAPIGTVLRGALGILVSATSPFNSIKDVIDYAKKNPGKLNYGSGGVGTTLHLYMELFKQRANVDIVHIPYKGGPPAVTALLAGDIQVLMFDFQPLWQQGKERFRLLAMTLKKRSSYYPDVPTVAESGGPEFDSGFWLGIFAPAQTPPAVVAKLSGTLREMLQSQPVGDYPKKFTYESAWTSPEEFRRLVASEIDQWTNIVRVAKIPLE